MRHLVVLCADLECLVSVPLYRQLLSLLSRRERIQSAFLLVAMIGQAAVELVGVASIAPFMSIVADPSVIHRNDILSRLYSWGGFTSDTGFLTAIGFGAIATLALSNGVSALTQWATLRFVWGTHHRLANRLLRGYLGQSYAFFVQRNTASLHKNVLSEVQSAISGVLLPVLTAIARSLVTLTIVGLLVAIDPMLALIVVIALGGAYGAIYLAIRRKQGKLGRIRVNANQERYKVTSEAFGGIKDVKVLQRESAFADRFDPPSLLFSRAMASNGAIAVLPRYLLETIAFGGILLIVVYYLRAGQGVAQILPKLSLYAFAAYRLMPALQQLFGAFSSIRFNRAALEDLSSDLETIGSSPLREVTSAELPLREAIHFEDVRFRYPGSNDWALKGTSLSIPRNQTVGLVGTSGAGKTTLVDLLLGLYEPQQGRIRIDTVLLDADTIPGWRRQIGYVPQNIFLSDDSIAANIAFGMSDRAIDPVLVERAARIAHLHDFIQTLPEGYGTVVGERGVRLSGGQRQRIGIARALYHDPAVLVMDEATSALDGATEDGVMQAIGDLAGQKTIILIAHRLSTVEECDCIFVLENGVVRDRGTYEQLIAGSHAFRLMAKIDAVSA